jgi:hypothetical protein
MITETNHEFLELPDSSHRHCLFSGISVAFQVLHDLQAQLSLADLSLPLNPNPNPNFSKETTRSFVRGLLLVCVGESRMAVGDSSERNNVLLANFY